MKTAPNEEHAVHLPAPAPFPPLSLMTDTSKTVTQALAANKAKNPKRAASSLFPKPWFFQRMYRRWYIKWDLLHGRVWTSAELDDAAKRGHFPRRPSDLFLQIYADVLLCLTRDPLAGNVSPSLIGTAGTCPLSIVSTIPDIMRHYYDCIVLAEKEVFLVTNYWQPSDSTKAVSGALVELNDRIAKRQGDKVVVKIMWDRGAIQQLWKNHVYVRPKTWVPLGLPDPETVPNLSLQVINFHRPLLGTFHQKTMVVDRKIALLNSNNIQDRPNVEMMVHLEGPIVDSLYDNLLLSWHETFDPKPPCLNIPSPYNSQQQTEKTQKYLFSDSNPFLANIDIAKASKAARLLLNRQTQDENQGSIDNKQTSVPQWWQYENWDWDFQGQAAHRPQNQNGFATMVQQFLERAKEEAVKVVGDKDKDNHGTGAANGVDGSTGGTGVGQTAGTSAGRKSQDGSRKVHRFMSPQSASKATTGTNSTSPTANSTAAPSTSHMTSSEATATTTFVNGHAIGNGESIAGHNKYSFSPDSGQSIVLDHAATGINDTSTNTTTTTSSPNLLTESSKASSSDATTTASAIKQSERLQALSKSLNAGALTKIEAAIDDELLIEDFKPHKLHKEHEPFPIALVNRRPHGAPGHNDIRTPQDAAWLAALRYAQKKVFIQTPTLNAAPIVRGVIEACSKGGPNKQGIVVEMILGLGFNDKGESVPFQGGTNEEVVVRLFKALKKVKKEHNLHVYWYTGKDQMRPLNAVHKSRNCHVKFMSVDDQCAIVGNGNLLSLKSVRDTQSFMHSQEANVLIDDPQVVKDWLDQLRTNQSSHKFGRVDTDGIWRDQETGQQLEKPKDVNIFSAMYAMVKK
ncbi:hypothetical protein OIO90_002290 [Microbotryomycetes sp. JL221]|nr:hypothetical protein OIO90_002290 [Microbotryomycetes sp. JL221]